MLAPGSLLGVSGTMELNALVNNKGNVKFEVYQVLPSGRYLQICNFAYGAISVDANCRVALRLDFTVNSIYELRLSLVEGAERADMPAAFRVV